MENKSTLNQEGKKGKVNEKINEKINKQINRSIV